MKGTVQILSSCQICLILNIAQCVDECMGRILLHHDVKKAPLCPNFDSLFLLNYVMDTSLIRVTYGSRSFHMFCWHTEYLAVFIFKRYHGTFHFAKCRQYKEEF